MDLLKTNNLEFFLNSSLNKNIYQNNPGISIKRYKH